MTAILEEQNKLEKWYDEGTRATMTLFWAKPQDFYIALGRLHSTGNFVYMYKGVLRSFFSLNVEGYEGKRMAIMGTDGIIGEVVVQEH